MANYTRAKTWVDGEPLTGSDLNEEFNRIQAVLNGGLDQNNFAAGQYELPTIVNAGAARFQTGGLDNADLVAAAIAEAVAGSIKVVFVPRTLFGYGGEAGYSGSIFNTNVHMVREGQMGPGHDPVAYGAKPGDALVDDQTAFGAANAAAAASAIGANPGGKWIEVTLPGAYQLNSNVNLSANVGYIEYPGVTLAGTGVIVSAIGEERSGVIPLYGLANDTLTAAPGLVNILASASNTGAANFGRPMDDWALLYLEITVNEDSGANVVRCSGLAGVHVVTTNGDTVIDFIKDNAGAATLVQWTTTNTDGASAHNFDVSVKAVFAKKEAW